MTMYLCPVCHGDGAVHCYCDRRGIVTEADIESFRADVPDILVQPLPPPPASMDKPCHDCAFRSDSPEREDSFGSWLKILEGVAEGEQFFCHQGMHCTAAGKYVPIAMNERGQPVGHPVCAGWIIARKRIAEGKRIR